MDAGNRRLYSDTWHRYKPANIKQLIKYFRISRIHDVQV